MKWKIVVAVLTAVMLAAAGAVWAEDADPGTMDTDAKVMALQADGSDTEVVASYFPETGGAAAVSIPRTLSGYGSYNFRAADSGLSGPWAGSMVVSSDKPVAMVGELVLTGGSADDGQNINYFEAFTDPSDTLYFPYAVWAEHPSTGEKVHYSQFYVQNTGTTETTIHVTYVDRSGGTVAATDDIPGMGQGHYDLTMSGPGVPDLKSTAYWAANNHWGGGLIITSTEPVLTAALVHQFREYSGAYSAISAGDSTIFLTNIDRRIFECTDVGSACPNEAFGGITSLVVQNFDLTSSANYTVTFYSKTTGGSLSFTDSLGPGAAKGYNTRNGADTPGGAAFYENLTFWDDIPVGSNPQLGSYADGTQLWVGSAVVEGEPGSVLAAAVLNQQTRVDLASMYVSAAESDASTTYVFPIGYRYETATPLHWNLGRVMNVSPGTASVNVYFYNADGTLQDSWLDQPATQFAIVNEFNLKAAHFSGLGDGWSGSIVVTSTLPVVATTDVLWTPAQYGAYNGVPIE
jgi:hypothetical protein